MIIKEVSCEQFAGLKNKKVEFKDGINVVYGLNEAGKSTIIELIRKILFQSAKLHKTHDKEFINNYFPHNAIGDDGDFIDGKLKINNGNNEYNFEKKWKEKGGECFASIDNGAKNSNEESFKKNVEEAVKYEEGVFNDIVFSSQKLQQNTLESIFEETAKDDIKSKLKIILSQAFAEIGGADIDGIGNKINEKLNNLSSHFDVENKVPEKHNGRWKKDIGDILENYYNLEDAENERDEVENLENEIDDYNNEINVYKNDINKLEEEKENVEKFGNAIEKRQNLKDKIENNNDKLTNRKKIKNDWEKTIEKNKIEPNKDLKEVDENDVEKLREQENKKVENEAKLNALNLDAKIENYTGKNLDVINLNTKKNIMGQDGQYNINGSTEIKIDGVVDIKLYPKGIDIEKIEDELKKANDIIKELCEKYDVKNSNELRKIQIAYEEEVRKINSNKEMYERHIKEYEEEYISLEKFAEEISSLEETKKKLDVELNKMEEIPKEYNKISDKNAYIENIKNEIKEKKNKLDEVEKDMINSRVSLNDRSLDDLEGKVLECKEEYKRSLNEYRQYEDIKNKYEETKNAFKKNPMEDLEESFKKYVGKITQDGIKLIDKEGKNVFDSNGNRLTASTLSEGTKATIGLAFKLAVIEEIFDGNGLIILDDPFIDMDNERTNNACQLLKKFAENNQVIITTCDEKYVDLLKGCNKIELKKE